MRENIKSKIYISFLTFLYLSTISLRRKIILFGKQRQKLQNLYGQQISMRKNFPGGEKVRKSKLCDKKVRKSQFRNKNVFNFRVSIGAVHTDCPFCPDSFQTVHTVSRLSGLFPDCPDSFKTVQRVHRLSGQFPYCLDSF